MKKLSLGLFFVCILAIAGCTSDVENIPVSSNDLIDQNVVYKSETIRVDVEDTELPTNDFSKEEKQVAETNDMEVIVPPHAIDDENVDFVNAYYVSENPVDMEFEMAVAQAEARRGIVPSQRVVYTAPKTEERKPEVKIADTNAQVKRKLEVKNVEPIKNITFLSTVVYHSNTKADISNKDMEALKNVAKLALKKNAIVRVVGNSSSRSKDMKEIQNKIENFDLSLLRAQKVKDVIVKYGVPKDKVFISAVGDTEKVVEENMPINEAINRRTEVYLNY